MSRSHDMFRDRAEAFVSFRGMRIFTSILLTKPFEDWSEVRSPSRAARRLKRGFRQRIKHIQVPDPDVYQIAGAFHMHPETLLRFEREVARRSEPRP